MKAAVVATSGSAAGFVFVFRPREPAPVAGRVPDYEERREITAARLGFGAAVARAGVSVAPPTILGIEKLADELQT